MLKDFVALLTEAEAKSVPLSTPSLLQACHVVDRLLRAVADPELSLVMREDSHVKVFPGSGTLLRSQAESVPVCRDSERRAL